MSVKAGEEFDLKNGRAQKFEEQPSEGGGNQWGADISMNPEHTGTDASMAPAVNSAWGAEPSNSASTWGTSDKQSTE